MTYEITFIPIRASRPLHLVAPHFVILLLFQSFCFFAVILNELLQLPVRPFLALIVLHPQQFVPLSAKLLLKVFAQFQQMRAVHAVVVCTFHHHVVRVISRAHVSASPQVGAVALGEGEYSSACRTSEISNLVNIAKPYIQAHYSVKLDLKRLCASPFPRPCGLAPSLFLVLFLLPKHILSIFPPSDPCQRSVV